MSCLALRGLLTPAVTTSWQNHVRQGLFELMLHTEMAFCTREVPLLEHTTLVWLQLLNPASRQVGTKFLELVFSSPLTSLLPALSILQLTPLSPMALTVFS